MRPDGRRADQLRPLTIEPDFLKDPEGSAIIRAGDTWVLCTASVEERVPPFLKDTGRGWVTAEYAMLPRATTTRSGRAPSGRAKEIERLIGRALRASIDLAALGPRTITVDCDVLQADGGTRTASITGGFVALAIACKRLQAKRALAKNPIGAAVAAVSVGIVDGEARLDLPYAEDSVADVDMNVVMTDAERLVEIQGTAEHGTFDRAQLDVLCDLAAGGVRQLVAA
ncbi:MAG TPA: ribonuclease PH, partial [Polyangia bacterium]|nr:ribonuclease PH [Polyangia bacterium]